MIYNENAKWGRNPDQRKNLVSYIINTFGMIVTRKQLLSLISSGKCEYNELTWVFVNKEFKSVRGQYNLSPMIVIENSESGTNVDLSIDISASAMV